MSPRFWPRRGRPAIWPVDAIGHHTCRMVFFGMIIFRVVAGAPGSFACLHKRSLIRDFVDHSALPGPLLAFLIAAVVQEADGAGLPRDQSRLRERPMLIRAKSRLLSSVVSRLSCSRPQSQRLSLTACDS